MTGSQITVKILPHCSYPYLPSKATAALKLLHTSGLKSVSQYNQGIRMNSCITPRTKSPASLPSALTTETQQRLSVLTAPLPTDANMFTADRLKEVKVKPQHLHRSLSCLCVEDTVLSRKRAKLLSQQWKHPHPV